MMTQFDISSLYGAAFGYRGLPFPYRPVDAGVTKAEKFDAAAGNHSGTRQYTDGLPRTHSLVGAPLYMPTGFNVSGSIVQLPNEPIVTCSTRKRIVETALLGNTRRGTVKEIINSEDWQIKIQGLCLDMSKEGYPEDEVQVIQQLYELNQSIEIINYMMNEIFEIKNVVIKGLRWLPMRGRPFSQGYEIDLVSDEDFILIAE